MRHTRCAACNSSESLHQHHLIPKALGGSEEDTNLITLCYRCHDKIHAVTKDYGGVDHVTLVTTAQSDRRKQLEDLGLWQGSWRQTIKTAAYQLWKAGEHNDKRRRKIASAAARNADAAGEALAFARSIQPHILRLYSIHRQKRLKPPAVREIAGYLNDRNIKSRLGIDWSPTAVYNVLTRLGLSTKRFPPIRKGRWKPPKD
jgi:hypothetical protein